MKNSRIYYYARVSTGEQNLSRQIEAFKSLGADDRYIISDKQSGKDIERPNYLLLRNSLLRSGDTLIIKSLDRLSRNKRDIKNELEYYKSIGVRVKIIDMPTTMTDLDGQDWIIEMVNNIIIEVLSSVSEQERNTIKQRQQEGIQIARKQGKHLGRPKIDYPQNWNEVYNLWKCQQITARAAMKLTNTKKSTFYNLVAQYENK